MRVVFFGTPPFAASILQALVGANVQVVAVVSKPDRPQGRHLRLTPPAVKVAADELKIPCYQPERCSTEEFAATLRDLQADLFVVAAYGEIIKQFVLDIPPLGCINVHASILPRYRGAAPIQRCLMAGETESGVTIIKLVRQMDAGDMLAIKRVPIGPNTTAGELEAALCTTGATLLLEVVHALEAGTATSTPQDHALATLAPKITTEEGRIDWSQPPQAIHNLIRALAPHPGAWCMATLNGEAKRLKVLRSELVDGRLNLLELQLEGQRATPASDLFRNHPTLMVERP